LTDVLQWLTLFFGAMVAGAMVLEFMVILPTLDRLSAPDAVETIKLLSPGAWRYLPACGAVSTISAFVLLVTDDDLSGTQSVLMVAALVAVAGFLFMSAGLYRKEDFRVRAWPTGGIPEEWPAALALLHRLHIARMALYLTAYAILVGVIVST
jgi:hypothetical protein